MMFSDWLFEAESKGAEVQILSLSVLSPGRPDVILGIPFPATTSKATLFTLKEGSKYKIKFHFTVSKHIVRGLKYTYMVWKTGVRGKFSLSAPSISK